MSARMQAHARAPEPRARSHRPRSGRPSAGGPPRSGRIPDAGVPYGRPGRAEPGPTCARPGGALPPPLSDLGARDRRALAARARDPHRRCRHPARPGPSARGSQGGRAHDLQADDHASPVACADRARISACHTSPARELDRGRSSRSLPRTARTRRALRHAEPVGRWFGEAAHDTRIRGPRDDERRLRLVAREARPAGDPRRARRPRR